MMMVGEAIHMWGEEIYVLFMLSIQFCYKLKSTLKIKSIKINKFNSKNKVWEIAVTVS